MSRTYTTNEAAVELGVSVGRVRQLVINGLLIAEKRGRDLFITHESIEAAKKRKTQRGPTPKAQDRKPGRPRKG